MFSENYKPMKVWLWLVYKFSENPVGPLTSNARLLNIYIGPVDVKKGRSMDF